MTAPLTPEALVEALAQTMWEQSYGTLANASWAEAHRIAEAIPDGQAAWNIETVRRKAAEIVSKHFAPALAAANAELARLRAEVEAKDKALTEIVGDAGKGARCTHKASFKAWFARVEDIARTALARAATAREGA